MLNTHDYLKSATPIIAQWDITSGCNFRCDFCLTASATPAKDELNTQQAFGLIDKLYDAGILFLKVLGGEPFFRTDMIDILRYAAEKGMLLLFSTNASLINEKTASSLAEINNSIRYIQVSLYGADSDDYKRTTGREKGFSLATRGMQLLFKNNLQFTVLVVATEYNLSRLPEYYDFAVQQHAKEFRLCAQALLGRAANDGSTKAGLRTNIWNRLLPILKTLVEKQRDTGVQVLVDARPLLGEYIEKLTGVRFYFEKCTAARTMVHIDARGWSRPCPALEYLPQHLGERYRHLYPLDLFNLPFEQVWSSFTFDTFRDYYHPDRNITRYNSNCPYFKAHICVPCPITPCTCLPIISSLTSYMKSSQ